MVARFSFSAPEDSTFPIPAAMMAISADGRNLAFVAVDARGKSALWYRRLDGLSAVSLTGTDGAFEPFWSADSRFVGYFADGKLSTVDISSGRLQKIWDGNGNGGTWRGDGLIVFSTAKGSLQRAGVGGRAIDSTRQCSCTGSEQLACRPRFCPMADTFCTSLARRTRQATRPTLPTLETGAPRYLMDVQSKVEYVEPGWIVYVANGRLLAQRFDAERLALSGEPIALAGDLLGNAQTDERRSPYRVGFSPFRERPGNSKLELRDRSGKVLGHLGQTGDLYPVALSADDKRLLFRRNEDVWILDVSGGQETRITFDSSGNVATGLVTRHGVDRLPSWRAIQAHTIGWKRH